MLSLYEDNSVSNISIRAALLFHWAVGAVNDCNKTDKSTVRQT